MRTARCIAPCRSLMTQDYLGHSLASRYHLSTAWARNGIKAYDPPVAPRISRSLIQVKITGVTMRTCRSERTIPPKTGVANGFMNCRGFASVSPVSLIRLVFSCMQYPQTVGNHRQ